MAENLIFELELRLDDANKKLDTLINNANRQAATAGKKGGTNFGSAFISGATAIFAGFSLNNLIGGAFNAAGAYKQQLSSQIQLKGAVRATNNELTANNATLKDSTRSYDERAFALGLDTDRMYESVTATKSSTSSTKGLEDQIRKQERAFEDSTKIRQKDLDIANEKVDVLDAETSKINKQIKAIQKETEERITQFKITSGFNTLNNKNDELEIQIDQLELQKLQNKASGQADFLINNQNDAIDKQIAGLKAQKLQNEINLKPLEQQINLIKEQAKIQQDAYETQLEKSAQVRESLISDAERIRKEISSSQNKFDIDIEPAKRKLEDLRAITTGGAAGGTTRVLKKEYKDFIDQQSKLAEENPPLKITDAAVKESSQRILDKYGKYLNQADLTKTFSDLIFGGVTDVGQAEELIDRFVESASAGKSAGIGLGQAVQNLGFAFRTGNSAVGNLSGISENFEDIDKRGLGLLKQRLLQQNDLNGAKRIDLGIVTEQQKIEARRLGTLKVTEDTTGAFGELAASGALAQDELNNNLDRFNASLGETLLPLLNNLVTLISPFFDALNNFITSNPQLIQGILGVAAGALALIQALSAGNLIAALFGTTLSAVVAPALSAVAAFLAPLLPIIAAVVAAIFVFKLAYENNFLGFRDLVDGVVKSVVQSFNDFMVKAQNTFTAVKNFIQPFIDVIVYLNKVAFVVLVETAKYAFSEISKAIEPVGKFFSETFDKINKDFIEPLKKAFEPIANFISDIFKNAINFMIENFNKGLDAINQLVSNIPEIPGVSKPGKIPQIPKLAKGADFIVPPGFSGDKFPFMAFLNSGERVQVTPTNQVQGSYNSTEVNYINYGNSNQSRSTSLSFGT